MKEKGMKPEAFGSQLVKKMLAIHSCFASYFSLLTSTFLLSQAYGKDTQSR